MCRIDDTELQASQQEFDLLGDIWNGQKLFQTWSMYGPYNLLIGIFDFDFQFNEELKTHES